MTGAMCGVGHFRHNNTFDKVGLLVSAKLVGTRFTPTGAAVKNADLPLPLI